MTLAESAHTAFVERFGTAPAVLYGAPGRVNLIGEHTDYNEGFVLPCAINRGTVVACGSGSGRVEVVAVNLGEHDSFDPAIPIPNAGGWRDYVRGIANELFEAGHIVSAKKLAIVGDVPLGAGLSSSASLEIAVALALTDGTIDPVAAALLGQRAENRFVGCACGVMDQLVSACAQADHALLIDCRTLERRQIAFPRDVALIVIDSGIRHAHASSDYNVRRAECERAARHYGVPALRDLDEKALLERATGLDETTFRRARHVVTENERVLRAAEALPAGNLEAMGQLMAASHASMRDDYAITIPEIDLIVALANEVIAGRGGARMTGGGFGGSVVALVPFDLVEAVRTQVTSHYRTPTGSAPSVTILTPSGGASRL